jgi:hypothetical protein
VIALDPVLEFAGLIACVLSDFKHGDNDDLDRNRVPPGGGDGSNDKEAHQSGETSCAEHH